jgi:hypothetical protein
MPTSMKLLADEDRQQVTRGRASGPNKGNGNDQMPPFAGLDSRSIAHDDRFTSGLSTARSLIDTTARTGVRRGRSLPSVILIDQ